MSKITRIKKIYQSNQGKMEQRNYPTERKLAPTWQCPLCNKIMSSRGKSGHLEKVHGRGRLLKQHDPYPDLPKELKEENQPLLKMDVHSIITRVIKVLVDNAHLPNIVSLRNAMFQCEYLIRGFEINTNCTIEEAWAAFPINKDELEFFNPKTK